MTNEQYHELIEPYEDAGRMLNTRLEILNRALYGRANQGPVHNIQSRIKEKRSIEEKLRRLKLTDSIKNAKDYLQDIAGIRIICYFVNDIYNLVSTLKKQSDLVVIKEKDYITYPKPNGYRSYHIVLGMPVYYLDAMEYFPVEVQFRTMSMDFWASMEHRICYKKNPDHKAELEETFLGYARVLEEIERQFERYDDSGPIDPKLTEHFPELP